MGFQTAYEHVQQFEGGYANDSNDAGGETFRGISRVSHPDWEGWAIVDDIKNSLGPQKWNSRNTWKKIDDLAAEKIGLNRLTRDFYEQNYYGPLFNLIPKIPTLVIDKMFDLRVNMGAKNSNKILQRAINSLANKNLVVDGQLGPKTIDAAREIDPLNLVRAIAIAQEKFYEKMSYIQRNPAALPAFKRRARWIPNND
jgi:lysozyme family protein